jgi:hypothetical protein
MAVRMSNIVIFILIILLIATNFWWAYGSLDKSVTDKYQEMTIYQKNMACDEFTVLTLYLAEGKTKF